MSQFGWQLMALQSAELAGIPMPAETRTRMTRFLRSCSSGPSRGLASYRPGDRVSRTMTAEALVCRYFLEPRTAPRRLAEAADVPASKSGPATARRTLLLVLRHARHVPAARATDWERWNTALQSELLARQRWDGERGGSWDPDRLWGGYGGRVYSTASPRSRLEVYYRYLPLHVQQSVQDRLTDRPELGLPR